MVRHDIVKLIKWNDNFLIEKAKRIGHLAPSANLGNSCVIGRKLSGSYYSLQMGVDAGRADSAWHLLNTNGLSVIIPDWEGVLICLPKWWDCRFLRCWDYFINSSLFFCHKTCTLLCHSRLCWPELRCNLFSALSTHSWSPRDISPLSQHSRHWKDQQCIYYSHSQHRIELCSLSFQVCHMFIPFVDLFTWNHGDHTQTLNVKCKNTVQ